MNSLEKFECVYCERVIHEWSKYAEHLREEHNIKISNPQQGKEDEQTLADQDKQRQHRATERRRQSERVARLQKTDYSVFYSPKDRRGGGDDEDEDDDEDDSLDPSWKPPEPVLREISEDEQKELELLRRDLLPDLPSPTMGSVSTASEFGVFRLTDRPMPTRKRSRPTTRQQPRPDASVASSSLNSISVFRFTDRPSSTFKEPRPSSTSLLSSYPNNTDREPPSLTGHYHQFVYNNFRESQPSTQQPQQQPPQSYTQSYIQSYTQPSLLPSLEPASPPLVNGQPAAFSFDNSEGNGYRPWQQKTAFRMVDLPIHSPQQGHLRSPSVAPSLNISEDEPADRQTKRPRYNLDQIEIIKPEDFSQRASPQPTSDASSATSYGFKLTDRPISRPSTSQPPRVVRDKKRNKKANKDTSANDGTTWPPSSRSKAVATTSSSDSNEQEDSIFIMEDKKKIKWICENGLSTSHLSTPVTRYKPSNVTRFIDRAATVQQPQPRQPIEPPIVTSVSAPKSLSYLFHDICVNFFYSEEFQKITNLNAYRGMTTFEAKMQRQKWLIEWKRILDEHLPAVKPVDFVAMFDYRNYKRRQSKAERGLNSMMGYVEDFIRLTLKTHISLTKLNKARARLALLNSHELLEDFAPEASSKTEPQKPVYYMSLRDTKKGEPDANYLKYIRERPSSSYAGSITRINYKEFLLLHHCISGGSES